jgi:protein phosphatase
MTLARPTPRFRVTGVAVSHVGKLRRHNEDCVVFEHLGHEMVRAAEDDAVRSMPGTGALMLVADGMGGPAAGEIASAIAARIVVARLTELWRTRPATPACVGETLRLALALANGEIHRYATRTRELRGMGTTATAAVLVGNRLAVGHVGDSRAYLVRDGREQALTHDHSWTQHMVDIGAVSAEDALRHPHANILLRALGPRPEVAVDVTEHRVRDGDALVLCSDGLWSTVAHGEIASIVGDAADVAAAGYQLVDLANARGGRDNVTVLVARVARDGPGYTSSHSLRTVSFARSSAGVPSNTTRPCPMT